MRLPLPCAPRRCGFTLVELIAVISIVAILIALLLPALRSGRKKSTAVKCQEQLHQLGLAMTIYADNHDGLLPAAHSVVPWTNANPVAWTRPLLPYYGTTNLLRCPDFSLVHRQSPFSYFMGSRAAFLDSRGQPASLQWNRIQFPSQYILSGDANFPFLPIDADPDNYTQDTLFGTNSPAHLGKVNILFADAHALSAHAFDPGVMTHSYSQPGVDWGF
jgi:prepilin-type N-terminal cleavage/methylation domain-containing protein/prepilin-type processing-associated H-X9-DG protein